LQKPLDLGERPGTMHFSALLLRRLRPTKSVRPQISWLMDILFLAAASAGSALLAATRSGADGDRPFWVVGFFRLS
jgi:hypothetical protein